MKSEIETRAFSDVLEIRNGKDQKKVQSRDGAYPIYGSGGEMGRASAYLCPAETIILGRKGSINSPIFVREPFWNVDTAFGLIANRIILDPVYLFHFCKSFDFSKLNTTVTIPSLTKANLLKVRLPVPSMETPKSIAARLGKVCDLIDKRQAQLAQLDTLAKSLFVEMFETGNYKEVYLEEVVYPDRPITYGVVKPGKEVPGGVPIIKVKDFPDGAVKKTNILHASPEIEKGYKRSRVVTGDLLYSIRGTVGRMAFVPKELDGANITQDTARVSIDRNRFQPTYIMASLSVPDIRRVIEGKIKGGAVKGINLSDLRKIKIPLAGQSDQIEFARQIQLIDKSKFAIRKSLDELNRLYRSLLQQYFG